MDPVIVAKLWCEAPLADSDAASGELLCYEYEYSLSRRSKKFERRIEQYQPTRRFVVEQVRATELNGR
jgi:hypothetical protein